MGWTWYNIKELGIARVSSDVKGVTTGPAYLHMIDWEGAKKLGLNLTQEQVTLTGNGQPIDTQSSLGGIECAVETGVLTPEVEAAIYGMHHNEDPDRTRTIWHEDSGGVYVGLYARTDKVGTNGEDVWLWVPKVQFATYNKDVSENAHRNLVYNGAANLTKSSIQFEEINAETGILETLTKRFAFIEDNRRVAASLFAPEVGYLVKTTSFPITGHVVSANISIVFPRSLKRASINKSTILLKQSSTPVAFALSVTTTTETDDTIVINPTAPPSAATVYTVTLKEALQDIDGNHLEADESLSVTTAA